MSSPQSYFAYIVASALDRVCDHGNGQAIIGQLCAAENRSLAYVRTTAHKSRLRVLERFSACGRALLGALVRGSERQLSQLSSPKAC